MKVGFVLVPFVSLFLLSPNLCAQRPVPPGIRQADQVEAQTEKNIPPPAGPRTEINSEKVQRDADELASLAASIPPDLDRTAKGLLPKDLSKKLKRIEKLARQLRNELNP